VKKSKSKYSFEIAVNYSTEIGFIYKCINEADWEYREKVRSRLQQRSIEVSRDFCVVVLVNQYLLARDHDTIVISGKDQKSVQLAGEAMAKAIFSHKYVEPV